MSLTTRDRPESAVGLRRPALLVFDVNETLSDMAPMADRFVDVGAPAQLAASWFAGLLRDGFALTVNEVNPRFADLAVAGLRQSLAGVPLEGGVDDAVAHIMEGFASLEVHPDVVDGLGRLADLGVRLVTLSNGSASIAEGLLRRSGVADLFERFLSVEQAAVWKPARAAYAYALVECGVDRTDAMLVAVHPWDTDGAKRAGLSSAWIDRAGRTYPPYFLQPDVTVGSLVELADVLA